MAPRVIIRRNLDNLELLQLAQCAYADDLAVASLSFRGSMAALAPAFRSVDCIGWPQFELSQMLWGSAWHCRTRSTANMASTKSLVERLCDFKIYAISVLCFIGSVCVPDKATLEAENHALQWCHSRPGQRHHIFGFLGLALFVAFVLIWCACIPSALRLAIELQRARPRSAEVLGKSKRLVGTNALLFSHSLPSGRKEFLVPSMALSTTDEFDIVCRLDRNDTLQVPQKQKAED